jgi:hypothetical protein
MLFRLSYLEILTGSKSPPSVWTPPSAGGSIAAGLDDETLTFIESTMAEQAVQHGSNSLAENPDTYEGKNNIGWIVVSKKTRKSRTATGTQLRSLCKFVSKLGLLLSVLEAQDHS